MNRILIALLSLILLSCNSREKECLKFKTGTFKYIDASSEHMTVTRNDSIQIENDLKNRIKVTTSIKWNSNCDYVLTYKDVTNYMYKEREFDISL